MGYFSSLDISSTGLTAQRLRLDIISQNIANAETTRSENGLPYRRKLVVFEERSPGSQFSEYLSASSKSMIAGNGVRVSNIVEDPSPLKKIYNPGHPDADKDGYVKMPNVDVLKEMINMLSATRSYEANVTAINTTKSMALKALDIGR
jgi:flagellar basal-body rod protein FlgC